MRPNLAAMKSRTLIFLIAFLFVVSRPVPAQTPAPATPSQEELQRRVKQLEAQMEAMRDDEKSPRLFARGRE